MSESNISNRIRELRAKHGLTLEQVAQQVGVGRSTVRKWETGIIENMRRDKIAKLATALHTTPGYLMGWTDDQEAPLPTNIIPMPVMEKIPLLGAIACGAPILAQEHIEDYVDMPSHIKSDFALTCKGDSMINARIFDGDIVYIHEQPDVENGQIAAVLIGDEATLKKVYKYPNMLILRPENPAYEEMVFQDSELDKVKIIGLAVSFHSRVRHHK